MQAKWLQTTIGIVVAVGVGMILGDGVLTPAMSVVSACEGLQVAIPAVTRSAPRVVLQASRLPRVAVNGGWDGG